MLDRFVSLAIAARQDFIAHQEPQGVDGWTELLCGGSLVALAMFALVAI